MEVTPESKAPQLGVPEPRTVETKVAAAPPAEPTLSPKDPAPPASPTEVQPAEVKPTDAKPAGGASVAAAKRRTMANGITSLPLQVLNAPPAATPNPGEQH